ncbi:hypothetical protein K491DRAFT_722474 [Lophiostoma macrostomum CBS 122681]|uniref:Rad21/Rec8-like protein N-terminal domain-containing protein n=1 Tax=Lophiostoma macrostomum CBS 122681 TaxID=1314788 RepID=A0A6A6SLF2_9PLEO|nr:hypothetical protein K491DRAFT_722474 [Lophiostoma macrostomum CBS 122681]
MFYSHEVLTSRKYGVATVWLVATLGAKSSLRKVNRKAIREVNVPKACQTIIDPAAPMALRLQGNLLYGVSRVYLEQCGYLLSDAQNAHNAFHVMLKVVKHAGLDADAGKANPDQLMLPDDPSYLPDFAMPPPALLADLNLSVPLATPRSGDSQSLTPFSSQVGHSSPGGPGAGLIIPSSSSGVPAQFMVEDDGSPSSVMDPGDMLGEGIAEPMAADWALDEEGNFVDLALGQAVPSTPAVSQGVMVPSDAGASARVRQEHEEGKRAEVEQLHDPMDLDFPNIGDDLLKGEAFETPRQRQDAEHIEAVQSSPPVAAPMRRKKRVAKVLPSDVTTQELRNKDLADWNNNYLQNMAEAARLKLQQKAASQAKKNAEYWVWGAGIGGLGYRPTGATGPTPFDRLFGDNLFELFTGIDRKAAAGTKHDRDSGIDDKTQEEARRVRARHDEDEEHVGRAEEDEGMFFHGDDEVELPREAPSALDDQQVFSAMPWNMSASIRGSSVVPRSAQVGMPGSVGGPSTGAPGSLRQRGGRMVSASPLHGRGQPGGLDALKSLEGEDDYDDLGLDDYGLPPQPSSDGPYPEFEAAQPSLRVREALSAEGENFLTFVAGAITEKRERVQAEVQHMSDVLQAEAVGDVEEVLFEELLPPTENSAMVACQGLMMVLALGTKGLLNVRQDGGFQEIGLSLTDKAKAVQEAAAQEQPNEGRDEEDEEMAAGAGGEMDDDEQDSLYEA